MTFITAARPARHAARLGFRGAHITLTHSISPKITILFANEMLVGVGEAAARGSAIVARSKMGSPATKLSVLIINSSFNPIHSFSLPLLLGEDNTMADVVTWTQLPSWSSPTRIKCIHIPDRIQAMNDCPVNPKEPSS